MSKKQKYEGITLPADGGYRVAVWAVKDARLAFQSSQVFTDRTRARHAAKECEIMFEEGATAGDAHVACGVIHGPQVGA